MRRARLLAWCVSALMALVLAEAASRLFWRLSSGVPVTRPDRILYAIYPELASVDRAAPRRSDDFYDVLLLGGSVINPEYSFERAFDEQLALRGRRNVRIFNLARPGMTTRDSRLKYEALAAAQFELVLVYHGINDSAANNVPPDLFRDDYTHFAWYERANALAPFHGTAWLALPYTLRDLARGIRRAATADRYVIEERPRQEWLRYGGDVKSARPFEANLTAILDEARTRGDRAAVMTFGAYLAPGYSLEAFEEKRLVYALHSTPVEVWGRPADVMHAIGVHNDVTRRVAAARPGVLFVDGARLLDGEPRYFNDICHLTVAGSQVLAGHLAEAVQP